MRTYSPLYFVVKCKMCGARHRSRAFGELYRRVDEEGGGWQFRPIVKRRTVWGRVRLVGQFQTSGVVRLVCQSCPHKPRRTVADIGREAETAERNGESVVWV